MENATRILVCPLHWGLGHAARCIPIIHHLIKKGKEVVLAADGFPLALLREEFPALSYIHFPSYAIRYGRGKSQVWAMLKCFPAIVYGIYNEHRRLKKIIASHRIDCVLSDNRFGLWNKKIKSVYMTHQLMVKMTRKLHFLEPIVWHIHRFFIHKYNLCLIPDEWEEGGLAGDLTHKYPLPKNARFIGTLSRFSTLKQNTGEFSGNENYQIIAVLSGVEPQRSIFERILIDSLSKKEVKSLLVQGLPQKEQNIQQQGQLTIVSHLQTPQMAYYLQHVPMVICRSGYSSIMDLAALNKTALLVPTPGQTEQEYLATYLSIKKNLFQSVKQEELSRYLEETAI